MKIISLILSTTIVTTSLLTSCGGSSKEETIGKQVWMTKNLNVDKFQNGEDIPHAKTSEEWEKAGANEEPAWCYYDNDPANGEKYGKLYNWFAVNDSRGLAPKGYHIPSHAEWKALEKYLGWNSGTKMKSSSGWKKDWNGTNESGFYGLPGGMREDNGRFHSGGGLGYWWTSTGGNLSAYQQSLYKGYGVNGGVVRYEHGLSVRCIRD